MSRLAIISALVLWAGATLVLSQLRAFHRRRIADRIAPYVAGSRTSSIPRRSAGPGALSIASLREVLAPIARDVGGRLARLLHPGEELAVRLERIGSPLDVTAFRLRQLGWSSAAFVAAALVSIAVGLPPAIAVLLVLASPLAVFLALEQQIAAASRQWQHRVERELPVVSEQLGMLLSAGYSLGGAVHRVAQRGQGACSQALTRVRNRVGQGLTEVDALREWARLTDVDALHRLVAVLALNHETSDLGRLISEEARAIRRDVQRQLIEDIERRAQLVWLPVTVAALVPGVIFLAVPFVEALRLFAS